VSASPLWLLQALPGDLPGALLWPAFAYALAGAIGYAGYRARALTAGGALAACLVGGTIFGFGGLAWAALLVLFFVSSSALSFVAANHPRRRRAAEQFDKGSTRDAVQVLANGGIPALAALLYGLNAQPAPALWFAAFVGALAAATADTWATEIGVLSPTPPRLLTTGRTAEPGTSGAVTVLGTSAALAGALLIGLTAETLATLPAANLPTIPFATTLFAALTGGALGMLTDSLLGATLQASYRCPACGTPTESRVHHCGTPTTLVRGHPLITNDAVNVAGTLTGALVAALLVAFAYELASHL
jgi:uncharacterized protein (TIGR00297 family)